MTLESSVLASLEKKIDLLTRDASKPYFGTTLRRLAKINPESLRSMQDEFRREMKKQMLEFIKNIKSLASLC
ncbi:MAG TPA: hypothetical protein VF884_12660 [Nitrososphaeraceae archaeon]